MKQKYSSRFVRPEGKKSILYTFPGPSPNPWPFSQWAVSDGHNDGTAPCRWAWPCASAEWYEWAWHTYCRPRNLSFWRGSQIFYMILKLLCSTPASLCSQNFQSACKCTCLGFITFRCPVLRMRIRLKNGNLKRKEPANATLLNAQQVFVCVRMYLY